MVVEVVEQILRVSDCVLAALVGSTGETAAIFVEQIRSVVVGSLDTQSHLAAAAVAVVVGMLHFGAYFEM